MKNSAKFVLTLALTVASAASCHKEIAVQGEGSVELTLNPQVDVLTKAPIAGATFPNERTIVLSAYNNIPGGTSANFFQGITFRKGSGASWVGGGGSNPKYWPVSGSLDLLAYSADGFTNAPTPGYATKCSESVTLAVPAENKTKQVDILFAGATGKSASGSALSMQFKHAEAVVAFDAKADVAYDGTKNLGVTINSITLKNVKTNGTVTLKIDGTCTWSPGTAENVNLPGIPSGYNVPENYIHNTATKPFAIGETGLIVIPQTATSFTVNYTVHYGKDSSSPPNPINKTETFTYDIPSTNWVAGKEYVYQLEFKQDQILVNSTILPWEVIPGGATVPSKVSATYKDADDTKTLIDLCSSGTTAKLSAGAIVGFDWGDGRYEIIENTTGSEMILNSIPHSYPTPPSKSVNIYVRRGTLDFGSLKRAFFNLFNVYNSTEVILRLLLYTITKAPATHGTFTVSPESNLTGGENILVTADPNPYYGVYKMTYMEEGSSTVNDIIFSSNTGTFTMPECNTTVEVTFMTLSFTINSSNKKVVFAPGNLYAKKENSTWKWYFYDKQYKFNSLSMPNISTSGGIRTTTTGDTEIDLFCWGYSSNSTQYNDGSSNSSFNEWGNISGLPAAPYSGRWRTLTKAEWGWLLGPSSSPTPGTNCRTSSEVNGIANARYLKCKVNDGTRYVYGLMIFPDTFFWPTGTDAPSLPNPSYINDYDLTWENVPGYSSSQFEALEAAGVVFLPAAGYRQGTSVKYVGTSGMYWSSTYDDSSKAYYLDFLSDDLLPNNSFVRTLGLSVRLVSDQQ